MGIEKLTSSLISDAEREAGAIVEGAQKAAQAMASEEKVNRAKLLKEAEHEVLKRMEEHRREREAWARLEAKRVLAEAREDAINGVFETIFDSLTDLRKSDEYKKFLKGKVAQALSELKGKDIVIHCLKGERAIVAQNGKAKVVEGLSASGGAIVESEGGSVRIDLTLEALFAMKREAIRKDLYRSLFGESAKRRSR